MFKVVQPAFGKKIYFAYMGHKGDDSKSLLDALDNVILAMHKDGRLAALQKKWFGIEMDVPVEAIVPNRSDERRVGNECVRTCRSRWSPSHKTKKTAIKEHDKQ